VPSSVLSKETIMFLSGTNGFKNSNRKKRCYQKENNLFRVYHIEETMLIKVGSSELIWLQVDKEPKHRQILHHIDIYLLKEQYVNCSLAFYCCIFDK
jgi:hypothetical protein